MTFKIKDIKKEKLGLTSVTNIDAKILTNLVIYKRLLFIIRFDFIQKPHITL